MTVHIRTPYSLTKNIGEQYNKEFATCPDGDALCFIDGDMEFTVSNFGHVLHEYANAYPNSILTCWTNRTHSLSVGQQHPVCKSKDMEEVVRFAQTIKEDRTVTRLDGPVSMLLMVIPKHIWEKHKFTEINTYRPGETNMLGVDNHFTNLVRRNCVEILRMNGMIMYHQYRLIDGSKQHLL